MATKVTLKLTGDKLIEIQVLPGQRKLEIKTAGFKIETQEVTLAAGEPQADWHSTGARWLPHWTSRRCPCYPRRRRRQTSTPTAQSRRVCAVLGGLVQNDEDREIKVAADLPKEAFRLTAVRLQKKQVSDAGLAHFKDCKNLSVLNLNDSQMGDAGLAHFKDCKNLTAISLSGAKVSDIGPRQFLRIARNQHSSLWMTRR